VSADQLGRQENTSPRIADQREYYLTPSTGIDLPAQRTPAGGARASRY